MRPYHNPSRSSQKKDPSKARSALGLFFNPSLGASFSPIKETGRMFVHLIAMIFAQADLLDKRHPAVLGNDNRYGLFDIVQLAYERVEWRQENIGQIAIFLGVCSCLAICALGIVYSLFSFVFMSV